MIQEANVESPFVDELSDEALDRENPAFSPNPRRCAP